MLNSTGAKRRCRNESRTVNSIKHDTIRILKAKSARKRAKEGTGRLRHDVVFMKRAKIGLNETAKGSGGIIFVKTYPRRR